MKIITRFTDSDLHENIVSTIYISIGDVDFPNSNWTDFPVIIFNWWIEQLINQLEGKLKGEYLFMDGPYYFECEFSNKNEIMFAFKERKHNGSDLLFSANVKKKDFITEVKRNVNSILRECHRHRYTDKDVKQLEINFRRLLNVLIVLNKDNQKL